VAGRSATRRPPRCSAMHPGGARASECVSRGGTPARAARSSPSEKTFGPRLHVDSARSPSSFAAKERESRRLKEQEQEQRIEADSRRAEAQRESAKAALMRGDLLEARAKLRGSLEARDSAAGRILWWQLVENPLVWKAELGARVYNVTFSPNGHLLAAACADGSVYLFDAETQAVVRILRDTEIRSISCLLSRRPMAGFSRERWRYFVVEDGHSDREPAQRDPLARYRLSFQSGWSILAASDERNNIRIWDLERMRVQRVLQGHTKTVLRRELQPGWPRAGLGWRRLHHSVMGG